MTRVSTAALCLSPLMRPLRTPSAIPLASLSALNLMIHVPKNPKSISSLINNRSFNSQPNASSNIFNERKRFYSTTMTNTIDSKQIFEKVWKKLENEVGLFNINLPNDILFLIGAPGSGKGTVTPSILKAQKSTNTPICMSSLLQAPSMKRLIDQGKMIDDELVLEQLLFACMERDPYVPLVIDGFPRTQIQVEFLVLLKEKLYNLYQSSLNTNLSDQFCAPSFKVAILYVSKETSLARQLQRGLETRLHNAKVRLTGVGELKEERSTDLSEDLVETRYKAFEENMASVVGLSKHFPFHMVNADCQLDGVIRNILHLFDASYPQPSSNEITSASKPKSQPILHGFEKPKSLIDSLFA